MRERQSLFGNGSSGDVQLTIAPSYDLDNEVDSLRGKVTTMKKVRACVLRASRELWLRPPTPEWHRSVGSVALRLEILLRSG